MEKIIKDDELRKIFGHRLKQLRTEKNLTLQEFCDKLQIKYDIEISFSSVGNYERGYRVPEIFLLTKIAEFFDVSVDYLIGATDIKNAKVIQTSVFDENNIKHDVKIGISKDSDLSELSVKEVHQLVAKLKALGFDFDKIN